MNQRRAWVLWLSVVALALMLYTLGLPLATSQGPFLRSRYIAGSIPESADAEEWQHASPLILALSGQVLAEPMLPDPSVKSLRVWSVHNGHDIAFLLEWLDSTKNTELTPGSFRDGAALAFPIGEMFAFSCMGRADSYLNIWHWKADWQADLDRAEAKKRERDRRWRDPLIPRRASSVEELVAEGVNTMTSKREQGFVQGDAIWADGRWRVVYRRPIRTPSESTSAELRPGQNQVVSFAVWDGHVKERGARKAVGPWARLIIDPSPESSPASELE